MKLHRIVLLVFLFLLPACSVTAPFTRQGPAASAGLPDGTFVQVTETAEGKQYTRLVLYGGRFEISSSDVGPLAEGRYSLEGDRIVFSADLSSLFTQSVCGNADVYTYEWRFDPNARRLTFAPYDDACLPRAAGQTQTAWQMAP